MPHCIVLALFSHISSFAGRVSEFHWCVAFVSKVHCRMVFEKHTAACSKTSCPLRRRVTMEATAVVVLLLVLVVKLNLQTGAMLVLVPSLLVAPVCECYIARY